MPNLIKLAGKFKSELRQQYKDSMSYPDAAEIADLKRRGGDHPREAANKAFSYIEKSKNPTQAKNRAEEMFGDFDVDGAIEEAGGFDKAFKTIKPIKKAGGGIAKGARAGKQVVEAVARRAKKKKKSESPPSARRDMAKKDVFTGEKYLSGGPKTMQRMTAEYKDFLNKQAKKEAKKDKSIAGGVGLGVGTTTVVGGSLYAGGKRERERLKKEEERIKKFREKNSKPKNKTPVKKARGGMVTRWESKWG